MNNSTNEHEGQNTQCVLDVNVITGVSVYLEFREFLHLRSEINTEAELENNYSIIGELRQFFNNTLNTIATDVVNDHQNARIRLSIVGDYMTANGTQPLDITKSFKEHPIYRHTARREETISSMIAQLFSPEELLGEVDGAGSSLTPLTYIKEIVVQFITPNNYNANALSTSMRLAPHNKLNNFTKYLPYNNDKYCLLHCLLKTQLNTYTKDRKIVTDDQLELFYCSNFQYSEEPMDIIIMPRSQFVNIRTKKTPKHPEPLETNVDPDEENFLTKLNIKQYINTIQGHALVLNRNFFGDWKNGQAVCKKTKKSPKHEELCLQYHQNVDVADRTKIYKETCKKTLWFNKYSAVYRVPFCTFDWETRLVDMKHVPYSYSIFYFNIFEPEKSKIFMKSNVDPEQLVKDFVKDCRLLLCTIMMIFSLLMKQLKDHKETQTPVISARSHLMKTTNLSTITSILLVTTSIFSITVTSATFATVVLN